MKEPMPEEPIDPGTVVLARDSSVTRILTRRYVLGEGWSWNYIDTEDKGRSWPWVWDRYTNIRIVTVPPAPGKTAYQYAHHATGEHRSFCQVEEWDRATAREHEAWRTVTIYEDGTPPFFGPWLAFPWAVQKTIQ